MDNGKISFFSHLSELRHRIFISVAIISLFFIIAFHFSEILFKGLIIPMKKDISLSLESPYVSFVPKETREASLVFLAPAEAFWMHLKVSLVSAIIISLPIILFEVWRFISPGLLAREKKYLLPFIIMGTSLFLIGASFCFLIVLPFAMGFLLNYKTELLIPMISIGNYVDFSLKFILAFGTIFELPIALIFLTKFGLVTPQKLAKFRKYAVILAFVTAAILTPTPDAFNQILMAGPIIILYEIGIMVSRLFYRKSSL